MNFQNTKFITSAAKLNQAVKDSLVEVAFAGRSNAGKSSAINAITGINGLAKTSKTPGRTQLINFFEVEPGRYLVDLPGYGYAKVSAAVKEAWHETLEDYFERRQQLKGLVLIMDIRHPLKVFDLQMLEWAAAFTLPTYILLTKSDKLSKSQAKQTLLTVQKNLPAGLAAHIQTFSAVSKEGLLEARAAIAKLLNPTT